MSRKVCVITGTRADFGLLRPLIRLIADDTELHLQLSVTGMHLSPEFGLTFKEIEQAGFNIDEKIEILLSSDTPVGISKSMGLAMIGFAEAFERLKPDMILVLGDRFEIFSAAAAAPVCRIPIAHIHGGETTEGAIDEAFRHSITKMSHLHFTSTEEYRQRVIQLGEQPERVFNVGALGVENIRRLDLLSQKELESIIGFELGPQCILVTFHPVTLEHATSEIQFQNLLDALEEFPNLRVIFTKSNADTEGRIINRMIDKYVSHNGQRAIGITSMGQINYLSTMKYMDAVVGNSSSGIIEAPSMKTPTVNIGDRQKGRVRAKSIIDCEPEKEDIRRALTRALSSEFKSSIKTVNNPYEKENTAKNIKEVIRNFDLESILKKRFHDITIS